jgi:hypothetical protein
MASSAPAGKKLSSLQYSIASHLQQQQQQQQQLNLKVVCKWYNKHQQ